MELNQKLAVVTGVSKGLGLEVVKLLLDKGAVVAAGEETNLPSPILIFIFSPVMWQKRRKSNKPTKPPLPT